MLITFLAIGLIVVLVGALLVYVHRLSPEERTLLARAPAEAAAAGCGPVRVTPPYPRGLDRAHVGSPQAPRFPPLSTYPSTPPASGPHSPVPLDAGVYDTPPPIEEAVHSLEHAAVEVWYSPAATGPELARIKAFFARGNERNHVIVAPYDYPSQGAAGELPAGTQMAMVAWHHVRTCRSLSLAEAFDFVHRYRFDLWQRGAYQGDAPEKYAPI